MKVRINRNQAIFASLKRRGGCGINLISRSDRIAADGVVSSAKAFRPNDFPGLTTPSARTKVASQCFLTAHPPLLFKEGNVLARQFIQPNESDFVSPLDPVRGRHFHPSF